MKILQLYNLATRSSCYGGVKNIECRKFLSQSEYIEKYNTKTLGKIAYESI